jgi:hypothetical protein
MAEDTVWNRIDRELDRRKRERLVPSTWAALGEKLNVTSQVTTNWRTRGVPPKRYPDIAAALDWTVEQLLGRDEVPPPPTPPADDFLEAYTKIIAGLSPEDRQEVYAFALGRAFKHNPELAKKAADYALAGTGTPRDRGGHQGGFDTNYGDLDEAAGGGKS